MSNIGAIRRFAFGIVTMGYAAEFLGSASIAYGDDVTDFYFQQAIEKYFDTPTTARHFAMAGSSIQPARDGAAVFGNPAGLGLMSYGEFLAGYSFDQVSGNEFPTNKNIEQDSHLGMGALVIPLVPSEDGGAEYGHLGVAWNQQDRNWEDDTFDTHGERTQVTAAYSYPIRSDLSLGYSLRWTDNKFQSRDIFNYPMTDGFRHTLGAVYELSDEHSLGGSLFVGHGNHHALFGPGIKHEADTFSIGADLGTTFAVGAVTYLSIGADYRHLSTDGAEFVSVPENIVGGDENGNIFNARFGIEHELNDRAAIRAGYRYAGLASYNYNRIELNDLNGSANYNAFSLGAGYQWPIESEHIIAVQLDYGVEYRDIGDGDWQHMVTISVPFDPCRKDSSTVARDS